MVFRQVGLKSFLGVLLGVLFGASACRDVTPAPHKPHAPDAHVHADEVWTEVTFLSYLDYRQQMLSSWKQLARELRQADGGGEGAWAWRAHVERQRKHLEERGLSREKVQDLESWMFPLLARRAGARSVPQALPLTPGPAASLAWVPENKKKDFRKIFTSLQKTHVSASALDDARKQVGGHAVDLYLRHEEALLTQWEALLSAVESTP